MPCGELATPSPAGTCGVLYTGTRGGHWGKTPLLMALGVIRRLGVKPLFIGRVCSSQSDHFERSNVTRCQDTRVPLRLLLNRDWPVWAVGCQADYNLVHRI